MALLWERNKYQDSLNCPTTEYWFQTIYLKSLIKYCIKTKRNRPMGYRNYKLSISRARSIVHSSDSSKSSYGFKTNHTIKHKSLLFILKHLPVNLIVKLSNWTRSDSRKKYYYMIHITTLFIAILNCCWNNLKINLCFEK